MRDTVWFKYDHHRKDEKSTWLHMASAESTSQLGPGQLLVVKDLAVLAVRLRTSRHVSFGRGQETWNRISSNASFLQRVFYTKLNRRGSTSSLCETVGRNLQGAQHGLHSYKKMQQEDFFRADRPLVPGHVIQPGLRWDLSTHKLAKRDTVILVQRVL